MPTDLWSIPLDADGAPRGSYYLRHDHDAGLSDTLGVVRFANGRSVEPITGRPLLHFVATLGHDVSLEPADDEARAAMGLAAEAQAEPEPEREPEVTVEETDLADRDTEPEGDIESANAAGDDSGEAAPDGDDLDAIENLDDLRAIAAAEHIDGAERWQRARILKTIRAARAQRAANAAGDEQR